MKGLGDEPINVEEISDEDYVYLFKKYIVLINAVTVELDQTHFPRPILSYLLQADNGKLIADYKLVTELPFTYTDLRIDTGTLQGNQADYTSTINLHYLDEDISSFKLKVHEYLIDYLKELDPTIDLETAIGFQEVKLDEVLVNELKRNTSAAANRRLAKILLDYVQKCGIITVVNYYTLSEDVLCVLHSNGYTDL